MLKRYKPEQIICLDIETTGLKPKTDEILQLSIIDGNYNVLLNQYFKPDTRKRWPNAEAIHGISPKMVENMPSILEYKHVIKDILNNRKVVVGYNLEEFDLPFLEEKTGITIYKVTFDVMLKFAKIYGSYNEHFGNYTWQTLKRCARYYKAPTLELHDSLNDTILTLFCGYKMCGITKEIPMTDNKINAKPFDNKTSPITNNNIDTTPIEVFDKSSSPPNTSESVNLTIALICITFFIILCIIIF